MGCDRTGPIDKDMRWSWGQILCKQSGAGGSGSVLLTFRPLCSEVSDDLHIPLYYGYSRASPSIAYTFGEVVFPDLYGSFSSHEGLLQGCMKYPHIRSPPTYQVC
ncbi:UNVERIFIED_CONTAM: hypothetical protein Slati_4176700 [Sesamum latifolium]|uniref:Uncharacterized protein n=1 Tax=Sesamum latifolium TaxID=2727402 RepID=A0AAW2TA72_9LAMI